jgi:hypothetical protein
LRQSAKEFQAQVKMDEIEAYRQNLKIEPLEFSNNFLNYANLAGMAADGGSFASTYFQTRVQQVQKVMKELEDAYTKGFRMPGGSLREIDFRAYRAKKFKELDSLLTKSLQAKLYGGMRHPQVSKRVKINAKTIEHNWRNRSRIIPGLSKFYGNTVNFANAAKAAGYIAVPLGAIATYGKIQKACAVGEEACKKANYVEWSGFAGSVGGGWIAGYAAGAAILFVVGTTALGGLVAVGIVAGGAILVGFGGALAGEYLMKMVGEVLYEQNREDKRSVEIYLDGSYEGP